MSIFISPCLQEKDRGVSGSLRSSFNHTIITAKAGMGKRARSWGVGGSEWTKEEEVGTKTLLQLMSVSSVPEAAGLTGQHDLAERSGIGQSAGVWVGVGWALGHLDQRLWSFGKAVSRGRYLERPGEGRLAGAQGLPSWVPGPRMEAVAMVMRSQVMVGL